MKMESGNKRKGAAVRAIKFASSQEFIEMFWSAGSGEDVAQVSVQCVQSLSFLSVQE